VTTCSVNLMIDHLMITAVLFLAD